MHSISALCAPRRASAVRDQKESKLDNLEQLFYELIAGADLDMTLSFEISESSEATV